MTMNVTKASAAKPRGQNREKRRFWSTPETDQHLATIRAAYADMLGRDVSMSLLVRRAVALLHSHMPDAMASPEAVQAELATLMRVSR